MGESGVGCWWRGRVHRVQCCWVGREVRGAAGNVGGREGITEGSCGNQSCSESLGPLIFKSWTAQQSGQSPGPHQSLVRSSWDPRALEPHGYSCNPPASPARSWSSRGPFTPLYQTYDSSICSLYFIFNSRSFKASHTLLLPAYQWLHNLKLENYKKYRISFMLKKIKIWHNVYKHKGEQREHFHGLSFYLSYDRMILLI